MQVLKKVISLKEKSVIQHLPACAFQSLNKENVLFGWVQLCGHLHPRCTLDHSARKDFTGKMRFN